jgi:superfamily I DNA/RNA helicase
MLDDLNPQQREVAESRRHCLAVAGPGAGKTKTIAAKVALLLSDPATRVGAVTFSKDAALEMRERILKLQERRPGTVSLTEPSIRWLSSNSDNPVEATAMSHRMAIARVSSLASWVRSIWTGRSKRPCR